MATDREIARRWRGRLRARRRLLAAAERGLAWARRRRRRPRGWRVAKLRKRQSQVAYAQRVLDRRAVMVTSERGVRFIAGFEGFRSRPYRDPVGVWTIGYGHTEGVGPNTPPITRERALALLRRDLRDRYEPPVRELAIQLTPGQWDAVVSFVYNVGPGYLRPGYTMGDALRRRDYQAAADAFLLYDRAGGRRLPGLTRRRQAERRMFLDG